MTTKEKRVILSKLMKGDPDTKFLVQLHKENNIELDESSFAILDYVKSLSKEAIEQRLKELRELHNYVCNPVSY
jgi:hypothetical protein